MSEANRRFSIRPVFDGILRQLHRVIEWWKNSQKKQRRLIYGLLSLLLLVVVASRAMIWWKHEHDDHDDHDHAENTIHRTEEDLSKYGVSFGDSISGKLAVELKVPGEIKLNSDAVAHMVPRFSGVVRQIQKNLGDTVKKGDVLALFENNANLSTFDMRSQIDGVVIEKNISVGEVIGNGEEAFVVADLSQVWVDLYIYPTDLPTVHTGQKVRIADASSGREGTGTLMYVAPTVSSHTRTATARVVLPNPETLWRPGTFITGAILIDESEVGVMIDASAVQELNGVPSIFVKNNEGFTATPVKLGRRDDHHTEILHGVPVGARIATSGSFLLKSELAKGSMDEHGH